MGKERRSPRQGQEVDKLVELPYPARGINREASLESQPPGTTPKARNVRPFEPRSGRRQGSQRSGTRKFCPEQIDGEKPIQEIAHVMIENAQAQPFGLGVAYVPLSTGFFLLLDYDGNFINGSSGTGTGGLTPGPAALDGDGNATVQLSDDNGVKVEKFEFKPDADPDPGRLDDPLRGEAGLRWGKGEKLWRDENVLPEQGELVLCADLPSTLHATVTAASGTYAGLLSNVYELPLVLDESGDRKWQNPAIESEFCITVDCGPSWSGECVAVVNLDNSLGPSTCGGADYDTDSAGLCDDVGGCPNCGPLALSASVTFTSGGDSITFTVTE